MPENQEEDEHESNAATPTEINDEDEDEDVEAGLLPCCRICLESDSDPGVLAFFVLIGLFGLILHCSSLNNNDPRMAGCLNCCYGWGILDCFPASMEACFALVVVFVVVFAIRGMAYGFLPGNMAIQRIWQKHYLILTKRELTKEYMEPLSGSYSLPKLDPELA